MQQKIVSGIMAIEKLTDHLKQLQPTNLFLVTCNSSFTLCGGKRKLESILKPYHTIHYHDFQNNPNSHDLDNALNAFQNNQCDYIIGIGGGSAMDLAKATAILASQTNQSESYITGNSKLTERTIPLTLIPTTAGTGSEATHFSVIYIDKTKYSLAHASMLADQVILDAELTMSLPKYITASTGMDALCQAIESFWSVNSTDESRNYSKEAIQMILKHLAPAVNQPNTEHREMMLRASHLAGKAINIAQTTASHALSYPMTSYFNIAHGHAVALGLIHFITFNAALNDSNCQDPRGLEFAQNIQIELHQCMHASNAKEAQAIIQDLMKQIVLKQYLSDFGIDHKGIDLLIKNGLSPHRVKNNPKKVTENDLRQMLKGAQPLCSKN